MSQNELLTRLQQEYAARRAENALRFEQRVNDACDRCPGLRELIDARHAALLSGVRSALLTERKDGRANEGLSNELQRYNERIAALLKQNGLPADSVAPVYDCPACKDEGYVYDPSRRMCACMRRELNRRALDELGLGSREPQTFESFRAELFPDDPPTCQRARMLRARALCEAYADAFPDVSPGDMLFTGQSGLGKTFLLEAVARRVLERGFDVCYTSAYRLLQQARDAYFRNDDEPLRPMQRAPLLLIDDLGTEPLMENITVTQLFNLLNERQRAGLHTIVSTNLSLDKLRERYTERVTSRFLDSRRCRIIKFAGDDVRPRLAALGREGER